MGLCHWFAKRDPAYCPKRKEKRERERDPTSPSTTEEEEETEPGGGGFTLPFSFSFLLEEPQPKTSLKKKHKAGKRIQVAIRFSPSPLTWSSGRSWAKEERIKFFCGGRRVRACLVLRWISSTRSPGAGNNNNQKSERERGASGGDRSRGGRCSAESPGGGFRPSRGRAAPGGPSEPDDEVSGAGRQAAKGSRSEGPPGWFSRRGSESRSPRSEPTCNPRNVCARASVQVLSLHCAIQGKGGAGEGQGEA